MLFLALLLVPLPGGSGQATLTPLVNGDFEHGLRVTVNTSKEPLRYLVKQVGSVVPGETENRAFLSAIGWTAHIYSGQRAPFSNTTWRPHDGTVQTPTLGGEPRPSGALRLIYDPRDAQHEALVIAQALGQHPHAGVWSDPQAASFVARVVGDGRVDVRAAFMVVDDPYIPRWSPPQTIQGADFTTYRFGFDDVGPVTEFWLVFTPAQDHAGNVTLVLDDAAVEGAVIAPGVGIEDGLIEPFLRELCRLGVCI